MTNADIMLLAYPVIGAAAMIAAAFGMVLFFGYHKPIMRVGATDSTPSNATDNRLPVEGVMMRVTESEAASLLAERAARAQRQPEQTKA